MGILNKFFNKKKDSKKIDRFCPNEKKEEKQDDDCPMCKIDPAMLKELQKEDDEIKK